MEPWPLLIRVQFDTARADGQFRKPASNKKLQTLTGGFQFTPFEEGRASCDLVDRLLICLPALNTTVKWFVENYQNARIGNVKA